MVDGLKGQAIETFNIGLQWLMDLKDKQLKHSILDCSGCLRNESWRGTLAIFPVGNVPSPRFPTTNKSRVNGFS